METYDLSTYTTPSVYNSRATNVQGGFKQIGNRIFVHIICDISISQNNNTTNWTLFSGLPFNSNTTTVKGYIKTTKYGDLSKFPFIAAPFVHNNGHLAFISGVSYAVTFNDTLEIHGYYDIEST